jgi:hypothetical protein
MTFKNFTESLIETTKSTKTANIIQEVRVGETDRRNELVFFIKPEIFDNDDPSKIINSLQLIEEKFSEFDVEIDGTVILSGETLEKHEIMNRHYGFINQLSRKASKVIDTDIKKQIAQMLKLSELQIPILGGHEFLSTFDADVDALNEIWFSKPAHKLRSGFYFIQDSFQGQDIILVNGFHPSQLLHFTRSDHRILLMLLHTDTDWHAMKFDLVGETFPEKAKSDSIRGQLNANPPHFGMVDVSINTNGVHLSAGPFEAAFEVVNFFGDIINLDPQKSPPLAIKKAIEKGINPSDALELLENPTLNAQDLFSETENMNTKEAIDIVVRYTKNKTQ